MPSADPAGYMRQRRAGTWQPVITAFPHGTPAGYLRHWRAGQGACYACSKAWGDYGRMRRAVRREMARRATMQIF